MALSSGSGPLGWVADGEAGANLSQDDCFGTMDKHNAAKQTRAGGKLSGWKCCSPRLQEDDRLILRAAVNKQSPLRCDVPDRVEHSSGAAVIIITSRCYSMWVQIAVPLRRALLALLWFALVLVCFGCCCNSWPCCATAPCVMVFVCCVRHRGTEATPGLCALFRACACWGELGALDFVNSVLEPRSLACPTACP